MGIMGSGRTPLVRTDFADDDSWERIVAAVSQPSADGFLADLEIVSDYKYDRASAELVIEDTDIRELLIIFVADKASIGSAEMRILCVDPYRPEDRFRCIPAELWGVENNLALANMDFIEFAEASGPDRVFRGF